MIVSLCNSIGATVWGQTTRESNRDWLTDMGAEMWSCRTRVNLTRRAGELSPTVVFDPLGDGFTGQAIAVMAPHGRLVLFGTSACVDRRAAAPGRLPQGSHHLRIRRAHRAARDPGRAKQRALRAVADGTMQVSVGATFPLARVNDALEQLVGRSVPGKVLLDLRT